MVYPNRPHRWDVEHHSQEEKEVYLRKEIKVGGADIKEWFIPIDPTDEMSRGCGMVYPGGPHRWDVATNLLINGGITVTIFRRRQINSLLVVDCWLILIIFQNGFSHPILPTTFLIVYSILLDVSHFRYIWMNLHHCNDRYEPESIFIRQRWQGLSLNWRPTIEWLKINTVCLLQVFCGWDNGRGA